MKEQIKTLLEKKFTNRLLAVEEKALTDLVAANPTLAKQVQLEEELVATINDWGKQQLLARLDVIHEEVMQEGFDEDKLAPTIEDKDGNGYDLNQLFDFFKPPEEVLRSTTSPHLPQKNEKEELLVIQPKGGENFEEDLFFQLAKPLPIDFSLQITDYQDKHIYQKDILSNTVTFALKKEDINFQHIGRYQWHLAPIGWRNARKYEVISRMFFVEKELNPYE